MEFLFLLFILLAGLAAWLIHIYNRLQTGMQDIREGLSNLQASLKKRQHLSGQIIEIASGYLEHEQLTQLKVAQTRQDMGQMIALAQSFPQLRADSTCQQLMQQLESLEDDILKRREAYNRRVKLYNSYRNAFPVVLVAQKLSFGIVSYFDNDDAKFDLQAQSFERDDSVALQQLIGSSKRAMGQAANQAVKNLSHGVAQIRQYAGEKYAEGKNAPPGSEPPPAGPAPDPAPPAGPAVTGEAPGTPETTAPAPESHDRHGPA